MSQHLARVRFSSHGHKILHNRKREHLESLSSNHPVTKQRVLIQADFKEAITRRRRKEHGVFIHWIPDSGQILFELNSAAVAIYLILLVFFLYLLLLASHGSFWNCSSA